MILKGVAAFILAASATVLAQGTKDPGMSSHHASPKVHRSSISRPTLAPRAGNSNAAELARIESQTHKTTVDRPKPASSKVNSAALRAAQDKNKPMHFVPKKRTTAPKP